VVEFDDEFNSRLINNRLRETIAIASSDFDTDPANRTTLRKAPDPWSGVRAHV
jgi:hypothetical protein